MVEHEVPCPDGGGLGSEGSDPNDPGDDGNWGDNEDDNGNNNDGDNGLGNQNGGGQNTNDPNGDATDLPDDPKDIVITAPVIDKKECRKITDLFAANPTYLAKLQTLATKVTDDKEHSHSFHLDNSEHQLVGVVGSGGIDYPEYESDYKAFAHTHDSYGESGEGTLSVFSMEDLIFVSKLAYYKKLNSKKFVAFLATDDGTKYAITINDKDKLIDLFYNRILDSVPDATDYTKVLKYSQSKTQIDSLFNEYYDKDNPEAKIKISGATNEVNLKMFMNFLKEAGDPGVTLFESTDNFVSFKKIILNNDSSISREGCN